MAKIGEVENTVMGRTVLPHQSSSIHNNGDGHILQAYIMNHLIIGPLQKGAVDGGYRLKALQCQTGSKGHGMLLANSHIKKPFRKEGGELAQTGALGHGSCNGNYFLVLLGQPH